MLSIRVAQNSLQKEDKLALSTQNTNAYRITSGLSVKSFVMYHSA